MTTLPVTITTRTHTTHMLVFNPTGDIRCGKGSHGEATSEAMDAHAHGFQVDEWMLA